MPLKILFQYFHAHLLAEGADTDWLATTSGDAALAHAHVGSVFEQARRIHSKKSES